MVLPAFPCLSRVKYVAFIVLKWNCKWNSQVFENWESSWSFSIRRKIVPQKGFQCYKTFVVNLQPVRSTTYANFLSYMGDCVEVVYTSSLVVQCSVNFRVDRIVLEYHGSCQILNQKRLRFPLGPLLSSPIRVQALENEIDALSADLKIIHFKYCMHYEE